MEIDDNDEMDVDEDTTEMEIDTPPITPPHYYPPHKQRPIQLSLPSKIGNQQQCNIVRKSARIHKPNQVQDFAYYY